jgi:hypothetical protein
MNASNPIKSGHKGLRATGRALLAGTSLAASLLLAAPAQSQGCQLTCLMTSTLYNGNLGGLAGADAKCNLEFPGWKFARNISYLGAVNIIPAMDQPPHYGFVGGYEAPCTSWTSTSGATASYARNGETTFGIWNQDIGLPCNSLAPIWCCNF